MQLLVTQNRITRSGSGSARHSAAIPSGRDRLPLQRAVPDRGGEFSGRCCRNFLRCFPDVRSHRGTRGTQTGNSTGVSLRAALPVRKNGFQTATGSRENKKRFLQLPIANRQSPAPSAGRGRFRSDVDALSEHGKNPEKFPDFFHNSCSRDSAKGPHSIF